MRASGVLPQAFAMTMRRSVVPTTGRCRSGWLMKRSSAPGLDGSRRRSTYSWLIRVLVVLGFAVALSGCNAGHSKQDCGESASIDQNGGVQCSTYIGIDTLWIVVVIGGALIVSAYRVGLRNGSGATTNPLPDSPVETATPQAHKDPPPNATAPVLVPAVDLKQWPAQWRKGLKEDLLSEGIHYELEGSVLLVAPHHKQRVDDILDPWRAMGMGGKS